MCVCVCVCLVRKHVTVVKLVTSASYTSCWCVCVCVCLVHKHVTVVRLVRLASYTSCFCVYMCLVRMAQLNMLSPTCQVPFHWLKLSHTLLHIVMTSSTQLDHHSTRIILSRLLLQLEHQLAVTWPTCLSCRHLLMSPFQHRIWFEAFLYCSRNCWQLINKPPVCLCWQ